MAGETHLFRYLTNDEFFALTRAEKLTYLAAAILAVTTQDTDTPADRFIEPDRARPN